MKRITRNISVVLLFFSLFILYGCSSRNVEVINSFDDVYVEPPSEEEKSSPKVEKEVASEKEKPEPTIQKEMVENCAPEGMFNSGLVKVTFRYNNKNCEGVMDQSGEIIASDYSDKVSVSVYGEGCYSMLYSGDSPGVVLGENKNSIWLQSTEEKKYYPLGYCDGKKFLVGSVESGFAGNKYTVYLYSNGSVEKECLLGEDFDANHYFSESAYIGDGLFSIRIGSSRYGEERKYIYNTVLDLAYRNKRNEDFLETAYIDGYYIDDFNGLVFTYEDLKDEESFNAWGDSIPYLGDDREYKYHKLSVDKYLGEGIFLKDSEGPVLVRHDNLGEPLPVPEYPEGVSVRIGTDSFIMGDHFSFSGGYLPLLLHGMDDYIYVTIIDLEGNQQYEPVKINKEGVHSFGFYEGELAIYGGEYGDFTMLVDKEGNTTEIENIGVDSFDGKYIYNGAGIYDLDKKAYIEAYFVKNN